MKTPNIGKTLIQLYGLFWVLFAVLSLVAWDFVSSSGATTIPDVLEGVFGLLTPIATFLIIGALGYGLFRLTWWVRYLFTIIFILSLVLPPYNFTELDTASALFDALILYLIWVKKDTRELFKKK